MQIREWNEQYSEISKKYDALYHKVAVKYGFSDMQHWILYVLYSEERLHTQNEMAGVFGMPKQTLNSAIGKLRDAGYVTLTQLPGPRNNKAVVLTEAGTAVCGQCVAPLLEAEDRALAQMSEEENELFLRLSQKRYQVFREEIRKLLEEDTDEA